MRWREVSVLGSALLVVAACSFPSEYPDTEFGCATTGRCPAGYSCIGDRCVIPDANTGGDVDARPADADSPDAQLGPCGPVEAFEPRTCEGGNASLFRDDFSSDKNWETFDETSSCLIYADKDRMVLQAMLSIDHCYGLSDVDRTLALDARMSIEARPADGRPVPGFGLSFNPGVPSLVIVHTPDKLELVELQVETGAVLDTVASIDHDDIEHRFWGFRPVAVDALCWETSPDGKTWTEHARYELGPDQVGQCIRYEFDLTASLADVGSPSFDSLNILP